MYTNSARFYDALHRFKDYAAASTHLHCLIRRLSPNAKTLLDVACGTGRHLEYLREYYQVEGLDINPEMLKIARRRCPGVPFHLKNMLDFSLDRTFDVVACLFSSIGYVRTLENLGQTVTNLARHTRPRGIMVVEPWLSPQSYWTGRVTADFVDEPGFKIVRMYTSAIEGRNSIYDIHYLVGEPQGVTHFTERHEMGLFTHEEYVSIFQKADLEVSYDPKGLFGYGMYIGVKRNR